MQNSLLFFAVFRRKNGPVQSAGPSVGNYEKGSGYWSAAADKVASAPGAPARALDHLALRRGCVDHRAAAGIDPNVADAVAAVRLEEDEIALFQVVHIGDLLPRGIL